VDLVNNLMELFAISFLSSFSFSLFNTQTYMYLFIYFSPNPALGGWLQFPEPFYHTVALSYYTSVLFVFLYISILLPFLFPFPLFIHMFFFPFESFSWQ